jgi:ribosomal protein S18 acetylase RimI-like enzyme
MKEPVQLFNDERSAEEVTIRSYRPSDYAGFLRLWEACGFELSLNDAEEVLAARGADPRGFLLVAEADGAIIATVMGHMDRRWGWVQRLAVHPEHRRQGLGRRLTQEAERRGRGSLPGPRL